MRCVILSACPVSPELKRLLRPDDFIIACDAGYRNCAPLGCKPNIILGDFDTAPCPVQQNDDIIVLPHVKDDTDTEYAAKLASEKGFTEVLLLGALGGRRIEHTLSNLATGLGLEERLSTKVKLLSGGQRQALTLLMATMNKPKLLLLDEHTAALDPKTAATVLELSCRMVAEHGLTALMVTHNRRDAIACGNRLIMMQNGRIVLDIRGEEKKNLTVEMLLERFAAASGSELANDRMLLG